MRALFLIVATTCLASLARATLPLQDGEKLTYRVSWAVVPGAGEIKIAAREDTASPTPQLIVTTNTATRGLARWLLPFNAQAESIFDLRSGQLISLHEKTTQGNKVSEHTVTFDYATRESTYRTASNPNEPLVQPIPPGDPFDLIMSLLQTRSWDLKPGEKRDALVLFDHEFYELTIHMARYETMQTSLGTFKTIVLEPRMDKTPPKGMFKRGSSVRVWIAQDDHRLPVKFEVEFKIGTGTATLESYEGPAKPRAGTATADAKNPRS